MGAITSQPEATACGDATAGSGTYQVEGPRGMSEIASVSRLGLSVDTSAALYGFLFLSGSPAQIWNSMISTCFDLHLLGL